LFRPCLFFRLSLETETSLSGCFWRLEKDNSLARRFFVWLRCAPSLSRKKCKEKKKLASPPNPRPQREHPPCVACRSALAKKMKFWQIAARSPHRLKRQPPNLAFRLRFVSFGSRPFSFAFSSRSVCIALFLFFARAGCTIGTNSTLFFAALLFRASPLFSFRFFGSLRFQASPFCFGVRVCLAQRKPKEMPLFRFFSLGRTSPLLFSLRFVLSFRLANCVATAEPKKKRRESSSRAPLPAQNVPSSKAIRFRLSARSRGTRLFFSLCGSPIAKRAGGAPDSRLCHQAF